MTEILVKCHFLRNVYICTIINWLQTDTNSQSQLHEAATDCLCSALYQCEDINRYGRLGEALFERVMALHQAYEACVAQSDTDRLVRHQRAGCWWSSWENYRVLDLLVWICAHSEWYQYSRGSV